MKGNGYAGQTLWVNLSTEEVRSQATDIGILKDFIGGTSSVFSLPMP